MAYFETKIHVYETVETYITKCKRKSCYFEECVEFEYPCISTRYVEYSIVIGFSYPDVAENDMAIFRRCVDDTIYAVSGIINSAITSCNVMNQSCINAINNSMFLANTKGRDEFYGCLRRSRLSDEVINASRVEVFIRKDYN
ncbi:hypothetical protein [Lacrimispora celerecrescens]|uniref:Uncharacterized protein n=1 Tax=[Clostridium] celerecrescens 18A TaxID=1286362 RepID=A0A2M8Z576_9FIRM|nr:hypothetical protein [Lacrimispora celerecrescens]PJJ28581.1 hypothetical protein H171_2092 [[Clostridium] celerecrescens 18A]